MAGTKSRISSEFSYEYHILYLLKKNVIDIDIFLDI